MTSFGVVFWKVDFIASLSITIPSSEAFLVGYYSRCGILAVECILKNLTSRWKCTIACRVEHIHRKPLQMNNHDFQTHLQTQFWCQLTKPLRSSTAAASMTLSTLVIKKTPQYLNFRGCIEFMIGKEYKGSISSKGSLSETILVRKYEIFESAS